MDKVIDLIADRFPELIIILIVGIVVWLVAKFYFKRFVKLEDSVLDLSKNMNMLTKNINDVSKATNDLGSNMNLLSRNSNILAASIKKIEDYILKRDNFAFDELLRKCSPYRLTDIGEKLLEISGAKKCVDENIDYFYKKIHELSPNVALDVENYSLSVLNESTDNVVFNPIKNFVFNAPSPYILNNEDGSTITLKNAITLNSILLTMSIYLRDKYFERHPEYLDTTNL